MYYKIGKYTSNMINTMPKFVVKIDADSGSAKLVKLIKITITLYICQKQIKLHYR